MMKQALITGASSGIGLELASIMAEKGHPLILVARRDALLQKLKSDLSAKYGVQVKTLAIDLSEPGAAKQVYDFCQSQGLQVEILVNNAGFGDYGKFSSEKLETYQHMLQLNISTLTELTAFFLADMKRRNAGRILNIASLAGFLPAPNLAVYAATKAYVMHFTEALNYELRGSGVTATVLSPGVTETGFVSRAGMAPAAIAQGAIMDARSVALAGYEAMMAGRLNVVPGWRNRISAIASMSTPSREMLLRIAGMIFKNTDH